MFQYLNFAPRFLHFIANAWQSQGNLLKVLTSKDHTKNQRENNEYRQEN